MKYPKRVQIITNLWNFTTIIQSPKNMHGHELSEEDLRKYVDQMFSDQNKSGFLNHIEVCNVIKKYFENHKNPIRVSPDQAKHISSQFDKNGDGKIGKSELVGIVKQIRDKHYTSLHNNASSNDQFENFLDNLFPKLDKNKSGSLDYCQVMCFMNTYFQEHHNPTRITLEQAAAFAKKFDKNNDGTVSRTK